jgi:hypothetical protein
VTPELPTFGPYAALEVLGSGGMGTVYLARHPKLGHELAIKTLGGGPLGSDAQRERFEREIRALCQLQHPNVVEIVDAGEERGVPWFAMRRIEGGSLEDRLRRQGPLAPDEALALALQLCDGLGLAHEQGILHRDLKPDNVLCATSGEFVITDFGLTKDVSIEASVRLSKTGVLQGTPGYWAPEQASGLGKEATERTDVYGVGAVLYAALTGSPPIVAAGLLEYMVATREQPPTPPSGLAPVPAWLERVVLRCLEKAPQDRYPSLATLSKALRREAEGAAPRAKARLAPLVIFAFGLAALVGVAAALYALRGPQGWSTGPQEGAGDASSGKEAFGEPTFWKAGFDPPPKSTFVPSGGRIDFEFDLPADMAKVKSRVLPYDFLWSPDGKNLAFLARTEVGNKKQSALCSLSLEKRVLADPIPLSRLPAHVKWVAANQLLVVGDPRWGKKRILLVRFNKLMSGEAEVIDLAPSREILNFHMSLGGDWVAMETASKEVLLLAVWEANLSTLPLPPGLTLKDVQAGSLRLGPWKEGDRLALSFRDSAGGAPRSWIYDALAEGFQAATPESEVQPLSLYFGDTLPEGKTRSWRLPDGRVLRRTIAGGATPPAEDPESKATRPSGSATLLELLASSGEVLGHLPLDSHTLKGADLCPIYSSECGRYVLFATFHEIGYQFAIPGPGLWRAEPEGYLLFSLEEGRFLSAFPQSALQECEPMLMGSSREFLLVDTEAELPQDSRLSLEKIPSVPNPNHGIWSLPFSGGERVDRAVDLQLPRTWGGRVVYPGKERRHSAQPRSVSRLALVAWHRESARALGLHDLLVFWNSTQPIVAWKSKPRGHRLSNVSWSPQGDALAFRVGNTLRVWRPSK